MKRAIRTARSEEGRKLIAQARTVANSAEGRRLIEQAKRVGKSAGQAASPENRTRFDTLRDRLRVPGADSPRAGSVDGSGEAEPQRDPRSPLSGE